MSKKTPLYDVHVQSGAQMVKFFGWDMPLHYGSQIDEHHIVRQHAGMFDVSHMVTVDILGPGARDYFRHILANDVDKLQGLGKSLYSCMLNHHGGIIDDCLVYCLEVNHYRVVVNAANGDTDLAWLNEQAEGFSIGLHQRDDLAIVAIQGPEAIERCLIRYHFSCHASRLRLADRRQLASGVFLQLAFFGDYLPVDHGANVFALAISHRYHVEVEDLIAKLNVGPKRQVVRVGKQPPLGVGILVKQIDRLANHLIHLAREQMLQSTQRLD